MPKDYGQACPVAKALELLGERWTLLVVRDLMLGKSKFHEFMDSLPGISANVLSDRLKCLEAYQIVTRSMYSDHPPRAEYHLTPVGQELKPVIASLATWGKRFVDVKIC